jgi:hypothetical protein
LLISGMNKIILLQYKKDEMFCCDVRPYFFVTEGKMAI